MLLSDVCLSDV